jgi:signal transduction histidine kinase
MNNGGGQPWRLVGFQDQHAPMVAGLALAFAAVLQVALQPLSDQRVQVASASLPKIFLILIALATTLPLGLLWAQPRTAAVIIAVANLLSLGVVHAWTVAGLAALVIMLYRLGYLGARALSGWAAVAIVALALTAATSTRQVLIVLAAAAPLASWAGYARRVSAETAARSAQHELLAGSLLEHTVRGERARISRELHDVVAHHISMIAVQAETARLTTQGMPPAGAQRLLAIGDTARSALTEMRRLLGVLREDVGQAPLLAQRRPQPGVDQLNELLDEARDASGTGTRLIVSGWPTPLDPGVELAAYRIVQEALTNVRRHAPGAAVDVELRYAEDGLFLRIRDNGPGPQPDLAGGSSAHPDGRAGAGDRRVSGDRLVSGDRIVSGEHGLPGSHGLLGMRERAAAVGGTLRTGLAPGGGFLVEAMLPAKAEQDAA